LVYDYDNSKKWNSDSLHPYEDNNPMTTGEVSCPKSRSISCVIPENGTLSFSWMMRSIDDYSNFKFSKNGNKNIEDCASYSRWSDLLTYEVEKDDLVKWVFNLESPPCRSGQGWLYINYIKDDPHTNEYCSNNSISNNSISNNSISNNSISNNSIRNNSIRNNSISNKSLCRCSIKLTPISPKTGNKIRTIELNINNNKTKLINAEIQLNVTHDSKIDSNNTTGFLCGSILSCNDNCQHITITQNNAKTPLSRGSLKLKLDLRNPKNNSTVKVCLEKIMLKDINGNNVEVEIPDPCDTSIYIKKGLR